MKVGNKSPAMERFACLKALRYQAVQKKITVDELVTDASRSAAKMMSMAFHHFVLFLQVNFMLKCMHGQTCL